MNCIFFKIFFILIVLINATLYSHICNDQFIAYWDFNSVQDRRVEDVASGHKTFEAKDLIIWLEMMSEKNVEVSFIPL